MSPNDVIMVHLDKMQSLCVQKDFKYVIIKNAKKYSPLTQRKEYKISPLNTRKNKSLQDILDDKCELNKFREFLKLEFSEENLDFYLKCEAYKRQNPFVQQRNARKIYDTYIVTDSPREVNLDFEVRQQLEKDILFPNVKTFDNAQKNIYQLIENDSFKRYQEKRLTELNSNEKYYSINNNNNNNNFNFL